MASLELIDNIDRATQSIQQDSTRPYHDPQNVKLLASAHRLVAFLEKTEDRAWRIINAPTISATLLAVVRIGIFKAFSGKEQMSAAEITTDVRANRILVICLMRAMLVNGIFEEIGEEKHGQNSLSRTFSDKVIQTIVVGIALNNTWIPQLANFLESINYQNPVEPNNGLLQYAAPSKLGVLDYFKANPKVMETVNNMMEAQNANWQSSNRVALSSLFPQKAEAEVLAVDVGGNRGNALKDLRTRRPDLNGRLVFQDLPEVFAGAETMTGVEAMAYDFFTPQPKKRADVYLFRHVLHDWPDVTCHQILLNTVGALSPKSRLVIQDTVVPTTGASLLNASMDISVMLVSGYERSERQWRSLLESVGLKTVKITPPSPHPGEIAFDSMIEPVLA